MTKKSPNRPNFLLWALLPLSFSIYSTTVQAQLIPDNTLGTENSTLNQLNQIKTLIEGGATRGQNLFHSFLEFNINNGQQVYFVNPDGVNNILTRVTGDNISQIFGTLGVNGNANLFLLNPHGFIFGANATLDLNGSFIATTEAINLGNGNFFSAIDIQGSSLLNIQPEARFNNGVGRIENKANLLVKEGNNLILIADTVVNRGSLLSYGNLTLQGNSLDLQGTLGAQNNLTLLGNNNIQIRDTFKNPFIAVSGADMVLQSLNIDIFALNHPESGLFSGKDMKMRSHLPVIGDAHYWSGGSFKVETLEGNLGNLQSVEDPIIRTAGDVLIGSYQGASLHIIAGGKVEIPNYVLITGADSQFGLQETITLSDGQQINIDGKNIPTVDIRAGVNPEFIGTPFVEGANLGSFFNPLSFPNNATSADINVGTIIFQDATFTPITGNVLLTNQYQPKGKFRLQ